MSIDHSEKVQTSQNGYERESGNSLRSGQHHGNISEEPEMKAASFVFALALTAVHCFVPFILHGRPTRLLSHVLNQIDICTNGLNLTSELKKRCEEKIGKATKVANPEICSIHVKLKAPSFPKSGSCTILS